MRRDQQLRRRPRSVVDIGADRGEIVHDLRPQRRRRGGVEQAIDDRMALRRHEARFMMARICAFGG